MIIRSGKYGIVAGYVPRDAEVRTTKGGKQVCNFSVKGNETIDEGGAKIVGWVNCVAWRKACDVARYFSKGDFVLCAGELKQRSYADKYGEEKTVTELECDFVASMEPNASAPMFPEVSHPAAPPSAPAFDELEEVVDDDLPF